LLQRNNPEGVAHTDVLKYCQENLPENVVPANLVVIPEFPYTEWGTIDMQRLKRQLPAA
jgi:hypothetical protein